MKDVRHIGLMGGVDLADGVAGLDVVAVLEGRGVHLRNLPNTILQLSPPFIVTAEELRTIVRGIRDALDTVHGR